MDKQKTIKQKIIEVLLQIGRILLILTAASFLGIVLRHFGIQETNIAIIYLLAVLISALLIPGYFYGCFASILSAFAFNFIFKEPYYSISANAPTYIITFVIMTITALLVSALTSHSKLNERRAKEREAETMTLYSLSSCLTGAYSLKDIAGIAAETISAVICNQAGCLCFDEKGVPEKTFVQQVSPQEQVWRELSASEALMRQTAKKSSGFCVEDEFYDLPIQGRETILGTIRLPQKSAESLSKSQIRLLHYIIESIALAMDSLQSSLQHQKLREESTQERYRTNLLRSISHDLRTPLSGILGSTEMLLDQTGQDDKRYSLIEGIGKDAAWLYAMVENILNLTRLQDGKLTLNKQPEAVEEILGSAANQISRRYPQHDISINAPEQLMLVSMDAKLIIQVLINLLDNAAKSADPPGEISVTVSEDLQNNCAVFKVKDKGCGIQADDMPHLFELFYSSKAHSSDIRLGTGLGLAICDAIIKAHGGTIQACNRTDCSGAEFTFTLPLEVSRNEPA